MRGVKGEHSLQRPYHRLGRQVCAHRCRGSVFLSVDQWKWLSKPRRRESCGSGRGRGEMCELVGSGHIKELVFIS